MSVFFSSEIKNFMNNLYEYLNNSKDLTYLEVNRFFLINLSSQNIAKIYFSEKKSVNINVEIINKTRGLVNSHTFYFLESYQTNQQENIKEIATYINFFMDNNNNKF
tara:strand:+ start:158 stop:478 length:321 start_codon:yes stop_codon:yes gene_type:complete